MSKEKEFNFNTGLGTVAIVIWILVCQGNPDILDGAIKWANQNHSECEVTK